MDCFLSEPAEQEVRQSLDIEQEVLGLSEAAVYGIYMTDKPRQASIFALVITWAEVQQRSSEDTQLQELLTLLPKFFHSQGTRVSI